MKPDRRQGVYIWVTPSPLYVGSVAGAKARTFDRREAEHRKLLAQGTHHNDRLQAEWARSGGNGWRQVRIPLPRGDIAGARFVESIIIKALGKAVCNERG